MKFEWDPLKNQLNVEKHGLDFADASKVFRFPLRVLLDQRQDYLEERWVGLGVLDGRVVVIVFTEPDEEIIRVVSLRKALPNERKTYERYLKNRLGEG